MDRTAAAVARSIRLAREGDRAALSELLDAYRSYLRVLATSCIDPAMRRKIDASDVVQDVLLRAHREFDQFRGATAHEWVAWMRKILAHRLVDLRRHFRYASRAIGRERPMDVRLDQSARRLVQLLAAPGPSPSEGAQEHEAGALLADVLDDLAAVDREVLMLRSLQEHEWGEIALRMERSRDAVRMLWVRALRRLGDRLRMRMR